MNCPVCHKLMDISQLKDYNLIYCESKDHYVSSDFSSKRTIEWAVLIELYNKDLTIFYFADVLNITSKSDRSSKYKNSHKFESANDVWEFSQRIISNIVFT